MHKNIVTALLLATLAAGCASTADSQAERRREARVYAELTEMGLVRTERVRRVPSIRVRGWSEVDDRTLVVDAGRDEQYLISLFGPCLGLDFAIGIGFDTRGPSITDGDHILVRSGGARGVERCTIREIWALDVIPGYDASGELPEDEESDEG